MFADPSAHDRSSRPPRPGFPCPSEGGARALELEIPSDVALIDDVVAAIVRECAAHAYPRRVCALNVPVALSEALANAIVRAHGEDASKPVRVRACVGDAQLVVEVEDEGAGFDLDAHTVDPTTPDRLELEGGRGLFLMRSLMDRVERFPADDRGNVVRLTLRRS